MTLPLVPRVLASTFEALSIEAVTTAVMKSAIETMHLAERKPESGLQLKQGTRVEASLFRSLWLTRLP
jgi:hypothetical protein